MNLLIIMSFIIFTITWFVQGFNFATIMSLISTILFCARKVGHFCKFKNIVVLEVTGMFLTFLFQLLLKRFNFWECLMVIVLRCAFLAIIEYDMKMYVYVSEEKRKDAE